MSAGEAVGTTVFDWARDALGVTINEMFGQTEMNYIVGNSHTLWPAKPGSMGRPYPGHRIARDRRRRQRSRGRARWARSPCTGSRPTAARIRCSSSSTSRIPEAPREQVHRRLVPHRRSREARRGRLPVVPGPRRRHVQGRRLPDRSLGDRELPGQAPGGRQCRGRAVARRNARQRRQGVHRPDARALGHRRRWTTTSSSTCAGTSRPTNIRRKSSSSTRCR